uniref:Uncharacterized protein n=1 Tax=Canis lupus dingo TaxID=286419 RepID=A0A8C0KPK1_CANLU
RGPGRAGRAGRGGAGGGRGARGAPFGRPVEHRVSLMVVLPMMRAPTRKRKALLWMMRILMGT